MSYVAEDLWFISTKRVLKKAIKYLHDLINLGRYHFLSCSDFSSPTVFCRGVQDNIFKVNLTKKTMYYLKIKQILNDL